MEGETSALSAKAPNANLDAGAVWPNSRVCRENVSRSEWGVEDGLADASCVVCKNLWIQEDETRRH